MANERCYICNIFFNTSRPRQNGCHFPDDIFKHIFLNQNVRILINISLKFVPKGPINNIPALFSHRKKMGPGEIICADIHKLNKDLVQRNGKSISHFCGISNALESY